MRLDGPGVSTHSIGIGINQFPPARKLETELSPGVTKYKTGFYHRSQMAYPRTSKHVPFVDFELFADPFYVLDEIPGGVLLQTGTRC